MKLSAIRLCGLGSLFSFGFLLGYMYSISSCSLSVSRDYGAVPRVGDDRQTAELRQITTVPRCQKVLNENAHLLLKALKHMATARGFRWKCLGYRHLRSAVAIKEFAEAFNLLNSLHGKVSDVASNALLPSPDLMRKDRLNNFTILPPLNTSSPVGEVDKTNLPDVCPEKWVDMLHGFPYYFTGFDPVPCRTTAPFVDTVTFVFQFRRNNLEELNETLAGLSALHPGARVIAAFFDQKTHDYAKSKYTKLRLVPMLYADNLQDGTVLNKLTAAVETKYTLIVPQSPLRFDWYAKVDRLVRMVNYVPSVDIAGGSHRNATGHWSAGCYQSAMRNYAYRLVEGYDLSYNSCAYCDYITGPFVMLTLHVRQHRFTDHMWGSFAFLDAFERWKRAGLNTVACMDSMFYVSGAHLAFYDTPRDHWTGFTKAWELYSVQLPRAWPLMTFSCAESGGHCRKNKGLSVSPCCLKTLDNMLVFTFEQLKSVGIDAEVEAGTIVGGVKFRGTLPWELDADYNYRSSEEGQSKFRALAPKFRQAGYSISEDRKCDEKKLNRVKFENCGYYAVRDQYWRIESWGVSRLSRDYQHDEGVKLPTLLDVNGYWFPTYPNPGLFARNIFGDDIYEHVEHWSKLGYSTGWIPYQTGSFEKCPMPGFHACLDQFLPVGNLQFLETWL